MSRHYSSRNVYDDEFEMTSIFQKIINSLQTDISDTGEFVDALKTILDEKSSKRSRPLAKDQFFRIISRIVGDSKTNVAPVEVNFLDKNLDNFKLMNAVRRLLFETTSPKTTSSVKLTVIKTWQVEQIFRNFIERVHHFVETTRCVTVNDAADMNLWISYLITKELFKYNSSISLCLANSNEFVLVMNTDSKTVENEDVLLKEIAKCYTTHGGDGIVILFPFVHRERVDSKSTHAGFIIIDTSFKTIERFEPHGKFTVWNDLFLDEYFNGFKSKYPFFSDFSYIPPHRYCPDFGPQSYAGMPGHCLGGGYCAALSLIFAHLRMLLLDFSPDVVIELLLSLSQSELLSLVRRYISWIDFVLHY